MSRRFPGLTGKATYKERRPGEPLRISIATPEIAGLTRNGGIGSTYANLAHTLAAAGHEVTILYLLPGCEPGVNEESVADYYKKQGIQLLRLPEEGQSRVLATKEASISYLTYHWLKQRDFDVIHFPEWMGLGYYSVLAKHQGLAFMDSTIVAGLHSPSAWISTGNLEFISCVDYLERDFMERKSIAYADVLVSPTQHMISWVADQGWTLPKRAYVQPHILPGEFIREVNPEATKVKELVFFGRLQRLKGLVLFCDAMDIIARNGKAVLPVTFLGGQMTLDGISSEEYIRERAQQWPFPTRIISNLDRGGALAYLMEGGKLAIIASLAENYPNTVRECCGMGIPFLASAVGGIPECITPEDYERVCFVPRTRDLASRLTEAMEEGVAPARSAVDFKSNGRVWTDWYAPPEKDKSAPGLKDDKPSSCPLVSVCLASFNRPGLLAQALESLRRQDYPNFEVLLVDDGSDEPEALEFLDQLEPEFKNRGWCIIRQGNKYLGAARNNAARHARGEYLLFMDDDNYAEPHEISTFVRAAGYSGADILTCALKYFNGGTAPSPRLQIPERVGVPLGAALDVGVVRNCFGDANALVRRSTFEQLGGFTEDYGFGWSDYEFFARAVLQGAHLEVVPEELCWYREHQDSMNRTTSLDANILRAVRPYLEALSPDLRGNVQLLQGYHHLLAERQLPALLAHNSQLLSIQEDYKKLLATQQHYTEHYTRKFEEYWNSWSWRSLRPIRNFVRRCRGLAPECKPEINSISHALEAINSIKHSATWHATRPLRALRKLVKTRFTS